uniref:F-box domain-containing protein n=1 Tax=Ditylenchus dipsaci TaxID=166011 RepID=A0A915E252_9BILA
MIFPPDVLLDVLYFILDQTNSNTLASVNHQFFNCVRQILPGAPFVCVDKIDMRINETLECSYFLILQGRKKRCIRFNSHLLQKRHNPPNCLSHTSAAQHIWNGQPLNLFINHNSIDITSDNFNPYDYLLHNFSTGCSKMALNFSNGVYSYKGTPICALKCPDVMLCQEVTYIAKGKRGFTMDAAFEYLHHIPDQ